MSFCNHIEGVSCDNWRRAYENFRQITIDIPESSELTRLKSVENLLREILEELKRANPNKNF